MLRSAPSPASCSRDRLLGGLLVLAAAALRLAGIRFGLPLDLRPDESIYSDAVVRILGEGTLHPGRFDYPALPFYLLAAVDWTVWSTGHLLGVAHGSLEQLLADRTALVQIHRVVAAVMGTLTVPLVLVLGRRLSGRPAGLLAAVFLTVAFLHVRDSHFGVVEAPMTFLLTGALVAIAGLWERGRWVDALLAGLLSGLAAAMKYLPAVLVLPLAAAALRHPLGGGRGLRAFRDGRLLIAGAGMIAGFLAGAPYTLLDLHGFLADLGAQVELSTAGMLHSFASVLGYQLEVALGWGLGLPLAALGALGWLAALFRLRSPTFPLALLVAAWLLVVTTGSRTFVRYATPLVPVVAVLGAGMLARRWQRAGPRTRLLTLAPLLALLLGPALTRSLAFDRLARTPTTYESFRTWLQEAAPESLDLAPSSLAFLEGCGLPPGRFIPWDPPSLVRPRQAGAPPAALVLAEGLRPLGPRLRGVVPILEAVARSREVWRAGRPVDAPGALVFDVNDDFAFPLAGLTRLEQAGPRVRVVRLEPRPEGPPPCPSPSVRPELWIRAPRGHHAILVRWSVDRWEHVSGFHLKLVRQDAPQDTLPPVWPLAAGDLAINLAPFIQEPGTWRISIAAVGVGGSGPPSRPRLLEVPRRP